MSVYSPKPVKGYQIRIAVKEFEMCAERSVQCTRSVRKDQTPTESSQDSRVLSHMQPSAYTSAQTTLETSSLSNTIDTSFDLFTRLYEDICERIIAEFHFEQMSRYVEELVSGTDDVLHDSKFTAPVDRDNQFLSKEPKMQDSSTRGTKPVTSANCIPACGSKQTTAADLLERILGNKMTRGLGHPITPLRQAAVKHQSAAGVAQEQLCVHRFPSINDDYAYIIPDTPYRYNYAPKGTRKQRTLQQYSPTILRDPAIVEIVPYGSHWTSPDYEIASSITSCNGQLQILGDIRPDCALVPFMAA